MSAPSVEIPNRSLFKAGEVCALAELQPYVLRSWEAEFPDLGVKTKGGLRVYRRADLERVLRLKHLLFVEGLTLAGARRRLDDERPGEEPGDGVALEELFGRDARERLQEVKRGLRGILGLLSPDGVERVMAARQAAPPPRERRQAARRPARGRRAEPKAAKRRASGARHSR